MLCVTPFSQTVECVMEPQIYKLRTKKITDMTFDILG